MSMLRRRKQSSRGKGECREEVVVVALEEVESGEGLIPSSEGLVPWRHVTVYMYQECCASLHLSPSADV